MPVVGLNIGLTALVKAFEEVLVCAQQVGIYFDQLNKAYQSSSFNKKLNADGGNQSPIMEPVWEEVIGEINFQNRTLYYDSHYLYRDTREGYLLCGSEYSCFTASFSINKDKAKAINIRKQLGYGERSAFEQEWSEVNHWQLPFAPKTYISYDRKHFPAAAWRHDRGFNTLWRLAGEDFHPFYYIFPSHYLIYRIIHELVDTLIRVVLDSQERTFLMPRFSSQETFIAKHLHYRLEAPTTPERTIIYLNEVGYLQLVTNDIQYNWELVCHDCSKHDCKAPHNWRSYNWKI